MYQRKTLTVLAVAAVSALLLSGCSAGGGGGTSADCTPAHEFSTLNEGSLTVAVVPVPHLIDIEGDKITGIEGEILEGFAKEECLTVAPQEIGGAGIIPAVQSDRVDVATGGWAPTPEREEIVGFSAPTFTDEVVILSRDGYSSFDELIAADATVGSPQGNRWVEDVDALLGGTHKIYQSFDETYNDLVAGRIDAALSTTASSLEFMASDAAADIERQAADADPRVESTGEAMNTAFPIRKGNAEFATALDAYIQSIRENGQLAKILEKWGMPESSIPSE